MKITYFTLLTLCGLCLFSFESAGQSEISIGVHRIAPVDNDKWVYDPGMQFQAGFRAPPNNSSRFHFTQGAVLGYWKNKPAADTLFYLVSETEFGFFVYEDKTVFHIAYSPKLDFAASDALILYLGMDVGYLFQSYEYVHFYPGVESYVDISSNMGHLVPNGGIRLSVTDHLGIFAQASYYINFDIGSREPGSTQYNSNVGNFDFFFAGGGGLFYRF